jgi:hypothetical protein
MLIGVELTKWLLLGWCISLCCFLTLPNNLFFTQITKQSINYGCREEVTEPILELCVVVEINPAQIIEERAEEVVI